MEGKKAKNIVILLIVVSLLIAARVGLRMFLRGDFDKPSDKTFSKEDYSITLTDEFVEKEIAEISASYVSSDVGVFVMREPIESFDGTEYEDATPEKYGELFIKANSLSAVVTNKDSYVTTNYITSDNQFNVQVYFFKGTKAYYVLQLENDLGDTSKHEKDFSKYVKSFKYP
jgi:hypothetical protein